MDDEMQNKTENGLPSGLGALLSDPAMLSGVAGALKKLGIVGDSESSEETDKQTGEESDAPIPALADITPSPLSALTADPEIIKKLPEVISLVSKLSAPQKKDDKRSRLLLALRPYLSDRRRAAIDRLITMNAIGDVLKSIK